MAYQVLARKWRPQTFAEVVGQEHISRTLKNAIVQNRIGHAYLFVGSRGIGKTTTARIFAKALNCPNNHDGEPCCKCESCLEVANGSSMDVIEIDGASHNKVEDIRDIRDNVQYAPTKGKYKIYIIDEVHMLTTQAWNALLKTLEEPPEHVKFLFATTEPHKVLPTIISRCQRFDLKRLSVPLIVSRLKQIATGENICIEDAALAAIARAADGGMRDAQSIFDQIIAFCGGNSMDEMIHEQDVIDVFGLASGMELREIAAAVFSNNLNDALKILQKLADSGRDLERLYADLIEYVRNIMVASLCRNAGEILEVSDTELQDLTGIGHAVDPQMIQRVLQELVAQEWSFRAALNKRIYFEATLARVMLEAHSVQLDDVFAHLNRISGTLPKDAIPAKPQIIIPPAVTQENPKAPAFEAVQKPAISTAAVVDVQQKAQPSGNAPDDKQDTQQTTAANVAVVNEVMQPVTVEPVKKSEEPKARENNPVPTAPPASEVPAPEVQPVAETPAPAVPVPEVQPVAETPAPEVAPVPEPGPMVETEATNEQVSSVPAPVEYSVDAQSSDDSMPNTSSSISSINDMLMQAAGGMDVDDDSDPALAYTDMGNFMEAYTPEAVHEKLVGRLAELNENNPRPAEVMSMLQPVSLGQYGLVLQCNSDKMSPLDMEYVGDAGTQSLFNQAFKTLNLSGVVKVNFQQDSKGAKVRYKPASFLELRRMEDYPAIIKANKILGTMLTDASIPEGGK